MIKTDLLEKILATDIVETTVEKTYKADQNISLKNYKAPAPLRGDQTQSNKVKTNDNIYPSKEHSI